MFFYAFIYLYYIPKQLKNQKQTAKSRQQTANIYYKKVQIQNKHENR